MIGKIVITALVLLGAWSILRRRQEDQSGSPARPDARLRALNAPENGEPSPVRAADKSEWRWMLYGFAALMVAIGGGLYYSQWQYDHEILSVRLIRADQQETHYEVYRHALGETRFVTVDGITVTVAANERMEVEGL